MSLINNTTTTSELIKNVLTASMEHLVDVSSLLSSSNSNNNLHDLFHANTVASLSSPQSATLIAQRGLAALHKEWNGFNNNNNNAIEFDLTQGQGHSLTHNNNNNTTATLLTTILNQHASAADSGVIRALEKLGKHEEWFNLSGRDFIVLGAFHELSNVKELLLLGGRVFAIDDDNNNKDKFTMLKQFCKEKTTGSLIVLKRNLVVDFREVCTFVLKHLLYPPLVENFYDGGYGSLDLAVAADSFIEWICQEKNETCLGFIISPFQVLIVNQEAVEKSTNAAAAAAVSSSEDEVISNNNKNKFELVTETFNQQLKKTTVPAPMGSAIQAKRFGRNDLENRTYHVIDGSILSTTTNNNNTFWFCQLILRWRAIVARCLGTHHWLADSRRHVVSANICATPSSFSTFSPLFSMLPQIMTCLLIRDLKDFDSPANPTLYLDNPMVHLLSSPMHCGVFTSPFSADWRFKNSKL